jgi:signal transduction histidine kinase
MMTTQMPYDRLAFFQKQLGLAEENLAELDPYRSLFASRRKEFARFFYDYFSQIPGARMVLEHETRPGNLEKVWAHWFDSMFRMKLDEKFFAYIWRSGARHVELNLDQRFVNLGYSIVRQFCHGLIQAHVPVDQKEIVSWAINRLVDLCLLVETHAYIEANSRCDREVVRGIAHQVRNPVTVIGGNIKRLQKHLDKDSPVNKVYDAIILESQRLERMVLDIHAYTEIFQDEPRTAVTPLQTLIERALTSLRDRQSLEQVNIAIDLDPRFPDVHCDARDIQTMFYYLLENSLEALSPENPYIKINSKPLGERSHSLQVVIFNTGTPPRREDLDNLFTPFYSSKPTGTGFGLPIARLAARKNLGELALVPLPDEGTQCVVTLPLPEPSASPGAERHPL